MTDKEMRKVLGDAEKELSGPAADKKVGLMSIVGGAAKVMALTPEYMLLMDEHPWLNKFVPDLLLESFLEAVEIEEGETDDED